MYVLEQPSLELHRSSQSPAPPPLSYSPLYPSTIAHRRQLGGCTTCTPAYDTVAVYNLISTFSYRKLPAGE